MKIGLAYDLKTSVEIRPGAAEDESEEYDPPDTIDALAAEIERLGHQVARLGGGAAFLEAVNRIPVDFVFNIAEGRGTYRSREAQIPGVLEMRGIPYSGSDPLTLAICLDKPSAKRVALSAGVATPPFQVIERMDDLLSLRLGLSGDEILGLSGDEINGALHFPLLVKPSYEGSSKGIRQSSRVERWDDLTPAVQTILQVYRQPALVEEFVPGTEVTVGVVGNTPPRVIEVMEVVPRTGQDENFMYSLEVKRNWRELVSYRCPPQLPGPCIKEIETAALTLYRALGCRDLARLDFRIDPHHCVHFLDANPLPGLGSYSDLPIMASLAGWTYSQLIETILTSALERCDLTRVSHAYRAGV